VVRWGKCEIMVHEVCVMLDLCPDWVILEVDNHNAFISISWTTNFRELLISISALDQIFPFV
jgi:hypothetical protein